MQAKINMSIPHPSSTDAPTNPHWFSANPDKAWGEKFFLVYSPVWILLIGLVVAFKLSTRLGDAGLLAFALLVALPLIVVPLFVRKGGQSGLRWYQTYWFKADVFIILFSFIGNYFGSEYFFDVLGMVYHYPQVHLTFDSALVGSGQQMVPVIMYLFTMAYFMTYHTTAVILLRRIRTSRVRWVAWLFPLAIVVAAFAWAWLETSAMANPLMQGIFYYRDMNRMLLYGSLVYACFFITSFPIFYFLDEKPGKPWSLLQAAASSLSASMLTLLLLDLVTKAIGHI